MHSLSVYWSFPFILTLLSIALCPILIKTLWLKYSFKILLIPTVFLCIGIAYKFGVNFLAVEIVNTLLERYIPLLVLLFALFVISGGIFIGIDLQVTPFINTSILITASLLAGWIGTTGASMLFIRPVLNLNKNRTNKTHIVIFFIFLVSNIGGGFTPLGDPPLLMGFLEGIDFFWPLIHIGRHTLLSIIVLASLFFVIDYFIMKKDPNHQIELKYKKSLTISGSVNIFLIICVIAIMILSSFIKTNTIELNGIHIQPIFLFRDTLLLSLGMLSLKITPTTIREKNNFNFTPIKEVAEIFFAIFITLIPVEEMLRAGPNGAFSEAFNLIFNNRSMDPFRTFFATGILSAFLDNAPTYLMFFNLAGADAHHLMTTGAKLLTAISLSSVFFGACTYIGNAPNLMVRCVAEQHKVAMPSFIGFMIWSLLILLPYYFLLSYMCFN